MVTTCRQCGRAVPLDAATCAGCGTENPGQATKQRQADEAAAQERADQRRERLQKVGLGVGAVAALVAVFAIFASAGGDDAEPGVQPNAPKQASEFGAEVACEELVEDMLKSPSTADFSEQERTRLSDTEFLVQGSVDSQNGFGATVRSEWSCRVQQQDGDWTLLEPITLRQR